MGSRVILVIMTLLATLLCLSIAFDLSVVKYENVKSEKEILRSEEEMSWLYDEWQVRFDKSYADLEERERRFEIFKDNLRFIDQHNDPRNNHTYTVGLNHLADLTNEEYRAKYLNPYIAKKVHSSPALSDKNVAKYKTEKVRQLPASVDWRTTGAVGPIINQGECGSCWAWTAAGAVEGLHHIQTGMLILLSAQQLVDCDKGSFGCSGGHVDSALNYIVRNKGIDLKWRYPYVKKDGRCKPNSAKVVPIDATRSVFSNNERALQSALAKQPVGIAIEAAGHGFQFYTGGIFNGPCGTKLDHAMLAIGYGTDNGSDYWLIKNTYGLHWGEDGFVRMARNIASRAGTCGIVSLTPYYPERRQGPRNFPKESR